MMCKCNISTFLEDHLKTHGHIQRGWFCYPCLWQIPQRPFVLRTPSSRTPCYFDHTCTLYRTSNLYRGGCRNFQWGEGGKGTIRRKSIAAPGCPHTARRPISAKIREGTPWLCKNGGVHARGAPSKSIPFVDAGSCIDGVGWTWVHQCYM